MLSKCFYRETGMAFLKGKEEQRKEFQTEVEPSPNDFSAITFIS